MIFVGKRQVGKTHEAIVEVVNRCNDGDVVGVISCGIVNSNNLKKMIERHLLVKGKKNTKVKVIRLEDRETVDHVLIDELDMLLGENCVCSTGGVINLKGIGVNNCPSTYSERATSMIEKLLASIDSYLPRPINYDRLHVSKEKAKELHGCYCPEYDVVVEKERTKTVVSVIMNGEKFTLFIQGNNDRTIEQNNREYDEFVKHTNSIFPQL